MPSLTPILKNFKRFPRETLDKLIQGESSWKIPALNLLLPKMIPFNAPHSFKLKEASKEEIRIEIPDKRINHNHLGGIHACAMATLGEFCSGLSLIAHLGFSQYRIILAKIEVEYFYQGRTKLTGSSKISAAEIKALKSAIKDKGKFTIARETYICDTQDNHVATVTAHWQLKSWKNVKGKNL